MAGKMKRKAGRQRGTAAAVELSKRVRDLQQRLTRLEQAHAPAKKRKVTSQLSLEKLAKLLGDDSEARIKNDATDPFERLIVLGFNDSVLFTINRSNGEDFGVQDVTIEIPDGTTRVLAFMRGWLLGFAETASDELTVRGIVDHHLGVEYANVRVQEVGVRTATIRAVMLLRDINGDDRWTGWVNAVVIYLGPHP